MTNVIYSLCAKTKMQLTLLSLRLTISLGSSNDCPPSIQRRTAMNKLKLAATLKPMLSALIRDESGQDLIEYALVAAIIALGATAEMTTLAGTITSAFTKIGTSLSSAV
jgi:pilus assembly protein Flp/PilA